MATRGNWMQTIGGRAFHPLDPRHDEIAIEDIAHALSLVCRFGGHVREHYSVADHSIRVCEMLRLDGHSVDVQLHGLLHDASEAYLGDVVWPLKQAPGLAGYKEIEGRVERAIFERFRIVEAPAVIKQYDLRMLATEKRDLMTPGPGREDGAAREATAAKGKLGDWHCDTVAPFIGRIVPYGIAENRRRFLDFFYNLDAERSTP